MRTLERHRARPALVLVAALIAALALAPAAAAALSPERLETSNWAGWEAAAPGMRMTSVSADYRAPRLHCLQEGPQDFGAMTPWVGLGDVGIEQAGVQAECEDGRPRGVDRAWYDNFPAPWHPLPEPVDPGDRMYTSVTVSGHRVLYTIADLSRHWTLEKTTTVAHPHLEVAEWIVEDPEGPGGAFYPFADFLPESFDHAEAATDKGPAGPISSPAWTASEIWLRLAGDTEVDAEAGPLKGGGTRFKVTRTNWTPPPAQPETTGPPVV